ncbi:MAG: hypothetical protein WKF31_09485 [Thermoleophilaceae bacterium]
MKPVRLAVLAYEEGPEVRSGRERGAGDGIGAHRHAAHGGRACGERLGGHELAERSETGRPQDRPLGVHVVLGLGTARQRHPAQHQGVRA